MRWLTLALLLSGDAYTIQATPVVMAGGTIKITCHVPALPPSSQDTLEVGVEGYTSTPSPLAQRCSIEDLGSSPLRFR